MQSSDYKLNLNILRICQILPKIIREAFSTLLNYGYSCAYFHVLELAYTRLDNHQQIKIFLEKRLSLMVAIIAPKLLVIKKEDQYLKIEDIVFSDLTKLNNLVIEQSNRQTVKFYKYLYSYFLHYGDFRIAAFFRTLLDHTSKLTADNKLSNASDLITNKKDYLDSIGLQSDQIRHSLPSSRRNDADFLNYVKNKTIAVVGPCIPLDEVGSEIDGFDIVIRPNFRLITNLPSSQFGTKTNVSYYNHAMMLYNKNAIADASEILDWCCLKSQDELVAMENFDPNTSTNLRVFFNADKFFESGSANGMQNSIYDLLQFSPKRIKLFCTDFFIGQGYVKTYQNARKGATIESMLSPQFNSNSMRLHDGFSNFLFLKQMKELNIIEVDRTAKEILDLDISAYANKIQELYGHHNLAE